MESQTTKSVSDWLQKESENIALASKFDGKKLPSLQFMEGVITEFEVDFSKPFETWHDVENDVTKAIIPVKHYEVNKVLWLNKKNPLYADLIHEGRKGRTKFKVKQTGQKKSTRYELVD